MPKAGGKKETQGTVDGWSKSLISKDFTEQDAEVINCGGEKFILG